MSSSEAHWCTIDEKVSEEFMKLKMSNAANRALVLSIDVPGLAVTIDCLKDDILLDDLVEDLSDSNPCYIIYSYKFERDDGRTQYPLLLIFYSPPGSPINVKMLSTNTKRHIMDKFQITKVFDVQDMENISDQWLKQHLVKYR